MLLWQSPNLQEASLSRKPSLVRTIVSALNLNDPTAASTRSFVMNSTDREWQDHVETVLDEHETSVYIDNALRRDERKVVQAIKRVIEEYAPCIRPIDKDYMMDELRTYTERKNFLLTLLPELRYVFEEVEAQCACEPTHPIELHHFTHAATDGSVLKKPARAGFGIFFVHSTRPVLPAHLSFLCPDGTTINQAELDGLIELCERQADDHLLIDSDSQYAITIGKLQRRNRRKGLWRLKNKARVVKLYDLLDVRAARGLTTIIRKVKSHIGYLPNEGADLTAKAGANNISTSSPQMVNTLSLLDEYMKHASAEMQWHLLPPRCAHEVLPEMYSATPLDIGSMYDDDFEGSLPDFSHNVSPSLRDPPALTPGQFTAAQVQQPESQNIHHVHRVAMPQHPSLLDPPPALTFAMDIEVIFGEQSAETETTPTANIPTTQTTNATPTNTFTTTPTKRKKPTDLCFSPKVWEKQARSSTADVRGTNSEVPTGTSASCSTTGH
jgi:ribonuclease HI